MSISGDTSEWFGDTKGQGCACVQVMDSGYVEERIFAMEPPGRMKIVTQRR